MNFAFLFGPPRMVSRQEASDVHNKLCDKLKLDDLSFRYSTSDAGIRTTSRGFSIVMERPEGSGMFRVVIDQAPDNPIRLLIEYHWPPSNVHVDERFDDAAKTVLESLTAPWQVVLAEARVRAQCDVKCANATQFLRNQFLKLPSNQMSVLGDPVNFVSLRVHITPTTQTEDPLEAPARELTIEVLREDPRSLYLELISRWTQLPIGAGAIELSTIRPINGSPKDYVSNTRDALNEWVHSVAENRKE